MVTLLNQAQVPFSITEAERLHWKLSEAEFPHNPSLNGRDVSLAAAVELSMLAASTTRDRNVNIRSQSPAWRLLKETNWTSRRGISKFRDGDLAAVVLSGKCSSQWISALKELRMELEQSAFPSGLAKALTGAVAEIVDNVWIHARTSNAVLAYQLRRRRFAFSVADRGRGVLESLRENPKYRDVTSSSEALKLAVQPGISASPDGTGLGFETLIHSLAELWGIVRIRSGEATMAIDRRTERKMRTAGYVPHMEGVHVAVSCSMSCPNHLEISS